jgi:hypothetical protein
MAAGEVKSKSWVKGRKARGREREEVRSGDCFDGERMRRYAVEKGRQGWVFVVWLGVGEGGLTTRTGKEKEEKRTSDFSPSRLNEHRIDSNRDRQHNDEKQNPHHPLHPYRPSSSSLPPCPAVIVARGGAGLALTSRFCMSSTHTASKPGKRPVRR